MTEKNPWIEPENYYAGYQDSMDNLKSNPEGLQFDKLCHLVLSTPDGRHFMEEIEKRFLIPALCNPASPTFQIQAMYFEGFKEAFRMLKGVVLSHDQRIKAEDHK